MVDLDAFERKLATFFQDAGTARTIADDLKAGFKTLGDRIAKVEAAATGEADTSAIATQLAALAEQVSGFGERLTSVEAALGTLNVVGDAPAAAPASTDTSTAAAAPAPTPVDPAPAPAASDAPTTATPAPADAAPASTTAAPAPAA